MSTNWRSIKTTAPKKCNHKRADASNQTQVLEHIEVKLVNMWNVDAVNCVSVNLYVLLFPIRYPQGKLQEVLHSESSNSHRLRHATSSLEKWQDGESVRGGGGIILALAPAYSPFVAAYFGALRCVAVATSVVRVKWKHSQVSGGLFLALPGSITNTTACLICLFPLKQAAGSCRGNYLPLISLYEILAARITPPHTVNTGHYITGGCCCCCCCC